MAQQTQPVVQQKKAATAPAQPVQRPVVNQPVQTAQPVAQQPIQQMPLTQNSSILKKWWFWVIIAFVILLVGVGAYFLLG